MITLKKFVKDQLSVWPLASANFRKLKTAKYKEIDINGLTCKVQYNPSRLISTTANTSSKAIAARPCFLCERNRPIEQFHIKFEGRKGRLYNIQVNPYPIFPGHLVIAREEHIAQEIWHHLPDMLDFCKTYKEYTVFYNGPCSGASAPDHLHFQAVPCSLMPLEKAIDSFLDKAVEPIAELKDARLFHYPLFTTGVFALKAKTSKSLTKLFYQLLDCTDKKADETEPKFNLYCYTKNNEYRAFVVMRSAKRSHHFYSEDSDHLTISPGAADMAGLFVAPYKEDFEKVNASLLGEMLEEVSIPKYEEEMIKWRLTRKQRKIEVGILRCEEISFEIISDGAGPQKVSYSDGRIAYNGMLYDELYFDSITRSTLFAQSSFILHDVVIGIDFHWQQKRTLKYAGGLKFIVDGDKLLAINCIGIEDYLCSVISSEMKASSRLELLKAHAIISRTWLQSRLLQRQSLTPEELSSDSSLHCQFDVCADDHCQRYQGLTDDINENVKIAIDQTWGQVLTFDGHICDTRYSKCCGGKTELFSSCWEDIDYPYLQSIEDPFCDCENSEILKDVLNDYDLQTKDFHDWTVDYTFEELSNIVKTKSGEDFGTIEDLVPLRRGPSNRIIELKIIGSRKEKIFSKELTIRKILSHSHLKSSAFEVTKTSEGFTLKGKGWGHGVGLCQIGAAAMAAKGYNSKEILSFYYPGSVITNGATTLGNSPAMTEVEIYNTKYEYAKD